MADAKAEDQKTFDLTIVLPVREEAAVLDRVLNDLCAALAKSSLEIIAVVDTRSVDRSAQILEEYAEALLRRADNPPMLRIISLSPPRCGSGTARAIGSREGRGKLVGWMDADGTYSASDLGRLVNTIGSADQVIGVRSSDFGRAGRLRFFVKSFVAGIAARLWHRPDLVDLNTGLRIFRRSSLLRWVDELPVGFSCTTTATLAALNYGQIVRFVQISYFPRGAGTKSKFHPVLDTARLLRVVWRQWRRKPKVSHKSGKLV
jgi:glycosyltransferase involved in cell wall biosynthesis